MNRCFLVAALCSVVPLSCLAQNVNGAATYVSFSVPGAQGTYPMSINSSMTVTGYYYVSATQTRGFIRQADGSIDNFSIDGAIWTEPEGINSAGDIAGFFELTPNVPQGFLRYADGRIVTFDPAISGGVVGSGALPTSINDFDDITGNFPQAQPAAFNVFVRSRDGAYTTFNAGLGFPYGTAANAINASGEVVGYISEGNVGFSLHADGVWTELNVPILPGAGNCALHTIPDAINAAGTIAGWYLRYTSACKTADNGVFVLSPQGVYTLFEVPGTLAALEFPTATWAVQPVFTIPHAISIDQAGDVTGSYTDASGVQHGFVRNPYGTLTTFDPPEGNQTTSTAINDGGAITGFYQYAAGSGPRVGFIRIPD
jgi:hypothetical protein